MSLSIGGFYTNTYESCNTNSYSTPVDFELDNQPMEYRTWLMEKLKSVGANPTDLADASQETLNQPTIQRIIQPPRNLAINGGEVEGDRSAVGFVDCRRNSHTKYLFSVKSTHGNKASL